MDTKIIVRKGEAGKKSFKGVHLDVLAIGQRSMVTKMNYRQGDYATMHQHPHEQCGYVVSGCHHLRIGGEHPMESLLHEGDSYAIPAMCPHSFETLAAGEVVDVFTPHREDYL